MARSRAIGALLALTLTLAFAPAAAHADGWVTVRYTGTYDQSFVYELDNPSVWQSTMHFAWDEHETFHLLTPDRSVPDGGPHVDIGGTVRSIYAPPNTSQDCSFSVAPRPGAPSPISAGWNVNGPVGASATMPIVGTYVQSTSVQSSLPSCGVSPNGGVGIAGTIPPSVLAVYGEAEIATLQAQLGGPTVSRRFDAEGTSTDGTTTASLHATMTLANSANKPPSDGARAPPKSLTPARKQAKIAALDALRDTLLQALYPCGVGAGVGTALIATGPVGAAVGGTMTALGTPLCLAYLKTIRDEADTVADPPVPRYRTAARIGPVRGRALRLPACPVAHGAGSPGAVCRRLAPAARKLLAMTRATGAAAAALDVTISRETAALAAHDDRAIALQDRTLATLGHSFAARRHAERAAAHRVASILRASGLNVTLAATAAATALTKLQSRLVAAGLPAAKLRTALGGPPQATASDLLSALER
jgi:hypothetical protein